MAIKPTIIGPGTMKLGATGTLTDHAESFMSLTVKWDKDKGEDADFLSGDTIAGSNKYTAKLSGKVAQDLSKSKIVDYSWKNKNKTVEFEYTPNTKTNAVIKGKVVIDPIDVGGDVKKRGESDIEWDIVGEPTFTPASTGSQ